MENAQGAHEQSSAHPMWVAAGEDEEERGVTIWVAGHSAGGAGAMGAGDLSFEEQFALSMERLEATLHQAGATLDDVVSVRAYVQDPSDLERFEEAYLQKFAARASALTSKQKPARTVLCNCLRPGLLFEIECVAIRPGPNLHVGG